MEQQRPLRSESQPPRSQASHIQESHSHAADNRSQSQRPSVQSRIVESQHLDAGGLDSSGLSQLSQARPARSILGRLPVSHVPRSRADSSFTSPPPERYQQPAPDSPPPFEHDRTPYRRSDQAGFPESEDSARNNLQSIAKSPINSSEVFEVHKKSLFDRWEDSPKDDLEDSLDRIDLANLPPNLEGLPLDPRKAGYKDYIDYLKILKADREELKESLKEVRERLTQVSQIQSRNLSQLQEQLSNLSFNVDFLYQVTGMLQKTQNDSERGYSDRSKVFTIRNEDLRTHPLQQVTTLFGEATFKVVSSDQVFCQRCLIRQVKLFESAAGVVQATVKKAVVHGETFAVFVFKFMQPQTLSSTPLKDVVLNVRDCMGRFEPMFTTAHEPIQLSDEPTIKVVKFSELHLPKNDFLFAECLFGNMYFILTKKISVPFSPHNSQLPPTYRHKESRKVQGRVSSDKDTK